VLAVVQDEQDVAVGQRPGQRAWIADPSVRAVCAATSPSPVRP
jgi:hypothetical protein